MASPRGGVTSLRRQGSRSRSQIESYLGSNSSSKPSLKNTLMDHPYNTSEQATNNIRMSDERQDDGYLGGKGKMEDGGSRPRPSAFVIQVTAIASLGGILFGYDLGVISGALPQLIQTFDLSSQQQELCVSILYVGGGLGAAIGGSMCDSFGRKRSIIITDVIFCIGAILLYTAPNYITIIIGRIVLGFAIALSGIADVTYLHEISPVQFRGAIVSVNEACISLGFLLAFAVGSIFSRDGTIDGWRAMFGISGIVALIQFLGMLKMPESPKWLKERGRHEESEVAMRRINNDYILYRIESPVKSSIDDDNDNKNSFEKENTIPIPTATAALYQSAAAVSPERVSSGSLSVPEIDIDGPPGNRIGLGSRIGQCFRQTIFFFKQFHVFATTAAKNYRKQSYIAIFLAVTQQLCGQTNVLSYAPLIFSAAAGDDDVNSSSQYVQGWSTLSIGLVKFAVTVIVIWKIESIGRRSLLLFGMGTIATGLLFLVVAFISDGTVEKGDTSGLLFALPGVLLVVCGYSMSFGPLTWLLTSELFPTDIRGRALGSSTIITYLCASFVTMTFLSAQKVLGTSIVFALYLLFTCLGIVFAYLAIPDTGEKNTEEIEEDLKLMPWWLMNRKLGEPINISTELNDESTSSRDYAATEIT